MLTLTRTALILAVFILTPILIAQETASIAAPGTQTAVSGGDTITVTGSGWTPLASIDSGLFDTYEDLDDGAAQIGQSLIDTSGLSIDGSGNLSGTFSLSNPPTGATRIRIRLSAIGGTEAAISGFLNIAAKPKLIGANVSGGILRLEFDQLMADPSGTASASTFTEAQATGSTAPDLTGVTVGDVTLDGGDSHFLLVSMSGAATALVQNNTIKVSTELLSVAGAAADLVIPAIACTETPSLVSAAYDATMNQLTLTFSLVVDRATVAANLADLGITDGSSPFNLSSATLDTSGDSNVMQLTFNNANDKTIVNFSTRNATVVSGNIQDTLGSNVGASAGVTISFTADASAPIVTDIRLQAATTTVLVTFDDMIDAASVDTGDFTISPLTTNSAVLQADGKSVLLTFSATVNTSTHTIDIGTIDNNSTLTISALTSQAISPLFDADATVTPGPLVTPSALDSIAAAASATDVFDFRINDGGATDGLPTLVTALTIDCSTSTTADLAEHTWYLNGPDATNVAATVSGTDLQFTGLSISVADATVEIYTLSVKLHATPSSTDDNTNDDWSFDIDDTDFTTNPNGTTFQTSTAVTAATLYEVTATQLTVASPPSSPTAVNAQIDATIHFTDAAGNIDTDNTGTVTCIWSEAGAVANSTEAASNGIALFDGNTPTSFAGPGIVAGTIVWASGGVASGATNPFHLQAADDADSTIAEGTASPATLSSIASATSIFYVDVIDLGTSDTLATVINAMEFQVVVSGGNTGNSFDWTLYDGVTQLGGGNGTVNAGGTTITFTGAPLISIADGTVKNLELRATPKSSPVDKSDFDQATIQLDISDTHLTLAAGSTLAAGTASNTTDTAVSVVATTHKVISGPTGTIAMGALASFTVEYVDANGNRDLGVDSDTLTATRSPAGALSNDTASVTNGLATFGTLTPGMPGSLSLVLTFTDDLGGDIDLSGSPFAHSPIHIQAADDVDSTVVELGTGPANLSSIAGPTQVFEIRITDLGTSDTLATEFDAIKFNIAISGSHDATDYTWTLHKNGGASIVAPSVLAGSVTFSNAAFVSIANNTNDDFQLKAALNATNSSAIDGSTMDITIAAVDFTATASRTTVNSGVSVDNATNTLLQVTATALNLTTSTNSITTGATIDHKVEYVDVNGNRDLGAGASEQITVTWNGTATVNNGVLFASSGLVDFNANSLNMTGVGLLGGILTFTDNAAGSIDLSGSPVEENPFSLISTDDADSTLTLSGTLTEPTTISSLATETSMLDFDITDSGLSDGLDTNITQVVVNVSGTGDADDGVWELDNGNDLLNDVGVVAGGIGSQTITFTVTSAVSDGGSETYVVSFNPTASPTNTTDNQTFILSVDETDITLAAGTTIAAGAAVTNGSGFAYDVVATAIAFVSNDIAGIPNVTILAAVEYIDAGGNRDLDVTDTVTVSWSGGGAVNNAALVAVAGIADFDGTQDMNIDPPGVTSGTVTFTDDGGGSITGLSTITIGTFNLVAVDDADVVITENGTGPATLSSLAGVTAIETITFSDTGTSDGNPAILDSITFTVALLNNTGNDATDFDWFLNDGTSDLAADTVTPTTVTFTKVGAGDIITIADGGTGDVILKANLKSSVSSSTVDGAQLDISIANVGITMDPGGTNLQTGQSFSNGVDTTVEVIATELRVVGTAPTQAAQDTAIALQVEYTDAQGNRDRDVGAGEQLTATSSDFGAVSNNAISPNTGLVDFQATSLQFTAPGAITGTISIIDNGAGPLGQVGGAITVTPFHLIADDDADSTISETASATALSSIAALTSVFEFDVTDAGTSDTLPTIVNEITFNVVVSSPDGANGFIWQLTDGSTPVTPSSTTATTVVFTGLSYSTANNSSTSFVLKAATTGISATIDNATIAIALDKSNIVVAGGATSTSFSAGTLNSINDAVVGVVATELNIFNVLSASYNAGNNITVDVEYVDAHGNRDEDVATDVLTVTRDDAGTVDSGATGNPTAGALSMTVNLGWPAATTISMIITDDGAGLSVGNVTSATFDLTADSDTTVTENSSQASMTSLGSFQDVMAVDINDQGTVDVLQTRVDIIVWDVAFTTGIDANDFTWKLYNGSIAFSPSAVTASTVTFDNSGSGGLVDAADGGPATLTLRAQVNITDSAILDGTDIQASVNPATITVNAGGSDVTGAIVSSTTDTTVGVTATKIQVSGTPPTTANTGAAIALQVEYTDAAGNRDLSVTDDADLTWSGSGTVTNGTVTAVAGLLNYQTEPTSVGTPGALGGTITITDQAAGAFNFISTPITVTSFDLVAPDDGNSTIVENGSALTTLSSIAGYTTIWSMQVTDLGTSDGLATTVTDLTINLTFSGSDNSSSFDWQLTDGTTVEAIDSSTVSSLTFNGMSYVAADSSNVIIQLQAKVKTATSSATIDNDTIAISVADTDVTVTGTSLAGTQTAVNGVDTAVDVAATNFNILSQPPASIAGGTGFDVSVEYVDANGNRDIDVTTPETATLTRTDAGTVTAGTSTVAANGIANFTVTEQVVLGGPTGTATTLLIDSATLTIAQATTTGITVTPIAEVTVATASGTMATTVSSIGTVVDVVYFNLSDAGADDADASITQVVVQLGGTADATDGAWTLDGPDHGTPLVGVISGSVPTQIVTFTTVITIADGTNEDYVVHFLPTATTLSSTDGQTFTATVAFGAVTAAASGSGMTSGTTSNAALAIDVIATEMRFASTPPATAGTTATISTVVNYTDINGNIDTAHAGTITATWSGTGIVANGAVLASSGVSDFGAAALSIGTPGALVGTITFDDGSFTAITITPFDLVSPDDADGTVIAGALTEPTIMTSLSGATSVFDFIVTDTGTSDGKTTDITQIVVNVSGPADADDAIWTISGAGISGTPTATVAGGVGLQTLTWAGLTINIADNSAETYLVTSTPVASPSATTDNQNWIFSIDDTDITTAGTGSSLTISTAVTNGTGLAYQVTATALAITTQPAASVVGGTGFDVVIEYVDANGNVDVDVTDTITALTRSDAGTVSGPSLPLTVTSGIASFTGGSQVVIGLPAATAITLTFTDDASGTLASSTATTTSFNVTDTTLPTVSGIALDVSTDITGRTIKVTFSEPVDQTSAETAANYTLQTAAVNPTSATRHATNLDEVTLVFADYAVGGLDTLDVSTVQDVNSNVMVASTGNAITSSDSTAPTLVAISFNDVDASSTVTAGDEYIFTFSEAMNDRPFAAGNTADSMLSPAANSYGTTNSMVMGEDVGFGTDSRTVIVTVVAGFTANGTEAITLGALTDVSGNTVTATSMTLNLTDTVGPRLISVALDDHDNSGDVTVGDTMILTFSEQIDPATVPSNNGPLDTLFLTSGSFGTGAKATFQTGDKVLEIEIGTGVTGVAGATIDPTATLTDKAGNGDITASAVTIGDGTTDAWGPTTTISYSANPAGIGNVTITANFSDNQTVSPTIAINQPGTNDTAATAMSMGANTRIWTYTYNVIPSDGVVNADGTNTVTIVGLATDAQTNAAQAATGTTFVTDTGGPVFTSAGVSDPDNFYMSGETVGLICDLGETGLTVTADLSVIDSTFSATTTLTDNTNNTYSITSAALSSGTLIEGSNLTIMLTATDSASNTTTFPVLVTIDKTAPTANLLYNQPSTSVGQGNLVITLQLNEPAGQVPEIAISGITGTAAVTATAMIGSVGDTSFTYTLAVISGSSGMATVTCTLVNDIAGNTQAAIGNNTFTVNAAGSPALTANAGTDVSISQPQIVTLDASASTGTSLTYAWVQETGQAVTITNGTTSMPTFICQTPDNYTFRVTVTSGASSGSDTVSVTLTNCVPEVFAGQRITLDENEVTGSVTTIGLQGDSVDCNNETLYFVWSLSSGPVGGNLLIDSPTTEASTLSLSTGTSIVPGVYLFQLDVYDPAALISGTPVSDTVAFIVTGTGVNPPASHAGIEQTTEVGTTVTLSSNEASDSDGTLAVFQWSIDSAPTGSTATLSSTTATSPTFTPDVAGIYEIGLRVTDNAGLTSDTVTVTLIAHAAAGANQLPRAVITAVHTDTNSNTLINPGESLGLDGSSSVDANNDTLTYQWKQISGPVLIIPDPDAATFTLTPSTSGQYGLELCVNDGTSDGICATYWFQVVTGSTATVSSGSLTTADDSDNDGRVLYIPGVGVDNATGNPSIELDGTASSGTGITHQWRQVQGPTVGLTNAATATASFTPVLSRVYVFELTVTDSSGTVDVSSLTIIVDTYDASFNPGGNAVPASQPVAPANTTPGSVVTLTGAGTDANTPQANWTWHWVQTDGPPVVLDLTDPQNPTFTPPIAGTYKFLLFIDDGADISTGGSVSIGVAAKSGGSSSGSSCTASSQGSLPLWILLIIIIPAIYIRRRRQA